MHFACMHFACMHFACMHFNSKAENILLYECFQPFSFWKGGTIGKDEILNTGIVGKEELSVYKYRHINETLETAVKEPGWKTELYGAVLQDAIHNLQELTASVKEYQRKCGIQSFDMPDESLAEIKKKKAALFKKLEWHQATCRKPKYVPYEKMTVYQKAEYRKMKEIERLLGKGKVQ